MKTTKLALALTTTLLAAGNASAAVFQDFTVDPINNNKPNFVADKITGNYDEYATFSGNTFTLSLKWEAGQFVKNDGSTAINAATSGLGAVYGLYSLYTASGTFSTAGGVTTFNFLTGHVDMYLDTALDTLFNDPADGTGNTPYTRALGTELDDILIATGGDTFVKGQGKLDTTKPGCATAGSIDCGSFGVQNSFALVQPAGGKFFVLPNPFYNVQFESGQLNSFEVSGTQHINGSMDVVFNKVPEPGVLALMGLGMLGLGFNSRKQSM
jgi:hypothetical protein